ncbi:transglutaminase-like domain-containing protein (plasmid) [Methylomonas sp. 2BW1-5-20]|uniref:transglutaminase-like domain-containing protein n=1 Tax=Methylomonas sp. 2BW1-5-20 TaxID=3376686 RepID=UPI004050F79C
MLSIQLQNKTRRLFYSLLWMSIGLPVLSQAQQPETPEIVFRSSDAAPLATQAGQLANAVAIYEYVHNTFEFTPYQGSRSGSVNTFLGQRGNDVDIATTLIAMLRSQNIPAHYAVGTVRLPSAQLTNWLGVGNLDVAIQILKDQGMQGVTLAVDRNSVTFEHVWAEALIHFDQYRGLPTPSTVDCSLTANTARCTWIPLDGSFKQKIYNGLNIDPYTDATLNFDYTQYYKAILNNDVTRMDKNPLTILEEQIGTWLHTHYPGKTLDDVADVGVITQIHDGLLPASLPYAVTINPRTYDSVAAHDAAVPATEPKKWGKTLSINFSMDITPPGGSTTHLASTFGPYLIATLNTSRLTLDTEFLANSNVPNLVVRLGGVEQARPVSNTLNIAGYTPGIGDRFSITANMDGEPDPTGGSNDQTITAAYTNLILGGYYLVAAGGEYSNWSQVHRAAEQLLIDNANNPIVFDSTQLGSNGSACSAANSLGCIPYVDVNFNGVLNANDPALLLDQPALDAMTGGLLYVAATQYFASLREDWDRADHLMKTKTSVIGFLGVVSSTFEAEYLNNTAFSIMPGGLLIDMKAIRFTGTYRANDTPLNNNALNNYSNRQFEFLVHMGSSLEHETWQELTGYDAISTVRGIQMGLADTSNPATLLTVQNSPASNTVPAFLSAVGFSPSVPTPFTLHTRNNIFGTIPNSWSTPSGSANLSFDMIKANPSGPSDPRFPNLNYLNNWPSGTPNTYISDYWESWMNCFYTGQNLINSNITTYGANATYINATTYCGVTWAAGTTLSASLTLLHNGFNSFIASQPAFFNYLDTAQGFHSTDFLYRSASLAASSYSTNTVASIRNDLINRDTSQFWVQYTLPSALVATPFNHFEVDIRRVYETSTGNLYDMGFEIFNTGH